MIRVTPARRATSGSSIAPTGVSRRIYVEAHMWATLAAAQSSGEARDIVAAKTTAEQIAEAQRRAREWTPTTEP